jgi:hypothetical protein
MLLLILSSDDDKWGTKFLNTFQCYKRPKFKRPYLSNIITNDEWYRYLSNDLHKWLKSYKADYTLKFVETFYYNQWYIDIPDDNKAMLFKLTWM